MKILVTNDDGIDAPGLDALETAARRFGDTITVAPDRCFSSTGHSVTTHRPLQLTQIGVGRFKLNGSPADCVRVGLREVETDVEWVLSGVNNGGNLGADIYMSGTVAAAREAMLLGKKAIAFSQYRNSREFDDWSKTSRMASAILLTLISLKVCPGEYWNVNFPDEPSSEVPDCIICPVDLNPLPVAYSRVNGNLTYCASYQTRVRTPGTDVSICFGGQISVSLLRHGFQ